MRDDNWRHCESCGITELSCRLMHRDTHAYCCSSCAHPDNEMEGR